MKKRGQGLPAAPKMSKVARRRLVLPVVVLVASFGAAVPADAAAQGDASKAPSAASLSEKDARELEARMDAQLKRAPGGVRVGLNQIAWDGGNVVMTFGVPDGTLGAARAYGPCDASWYCLYEAWYWNERPEDRHYRKLQFKDCNRGGYRNYLRNYNFENKTSSWDNRSSRAGVAVNDWQWGNLWDMPKRSRGAEVPHNDMADWLWAFC